ncbi:hypothetical protein [Reyranella sp.]|uniref:tetratricopeptide repeat protein n=1 Tax=Reyranella sp. TaxID=1929291 RepID=UPI003BA907A0
MTIARTLQTLQQMLDAGRADEAAATIGAAHAELAKDPRALLPLLDGLDRQRNAVALQSLVAKIQELNLLPLESSIFELRLKFRAGDYAAALQVVERVLSYGNDHIEALRTGARIGNLRRDQNLALSYWERLARVAPGDTEAPLQVARIHLHRKAYAEALRWAAKAAEQRPNIAEPLQIAVSAGLASGWPETCDEFVVRLFAADQPRALKVLARLMQNLDCERVARIIPLLQARFPGSPPLTEFVNKAASGWLVAALEKELASRDLEAASFYRAARIIQPGDATLARALDRLSLPSLTAMHEAFRSRDFANAIEHGRMAARINPGCAEAWQTVGRSEFARGAIAEAVDAFRRYTELNEQDAGGWLAYGLALNQGGDRCAALAVFRKAQELGDAATRREVDASISALHSPLVQDARSAAAAGDIDEAWRFSQAALSIRPSDATVQQLQRDLLHQQREQIRRAWNAASDAAKDLSRRYLEKVPGDTYAATVLGRTLMRMRAYPEALPVWEGLSGRNPEDSHSHLQVARCCRSLRIRDRGLAAAEAALRLDPKLQEAAALADFFRGLPDPAARGMAAAAD